jgi:hypothetical protein
MPEVDHDTAAESGFSGKDTAEELITGMPQPETSTPGNAHPEFTSGDILQERADALAAVFMPDTQVGVVRSDGTYEPGWHVKGVNRDKVTVVSDEGTGEKTFSGTDLLKIQSYEVGKIVEVDGASWTVQRRGTDGSLTLRNANGDAKYTNVAAQYADYKKASAEK